MLRVRRRPSRERLDRGAREVKGAWGGRAVACDRGPGTRVCALLDGNGMYLRFAQGLQQLQESFKAHFQFSAVCSFHF